jgi:fatty-acyl-CoA synthase
MPFFHTAGCVMAALGAIQAHATHAFIPAFEPARLLALIEQERATHTLGVPTMLIAMLEQPQLADCNLDALRVVASGGASVPPELVRNIESRFGASFCTVYGQTETSPLITTVRLDDAPADKAETVGKPLPQTEVKIIDPASREIVAHDTVGELCTRGYLLMTGYFDNPKATAATIDADGWLHTGDLATMNARGYVRITGRLKDMVIRGGENIYPREVEEYLYSHPDIQDIQVFGVPDTKYGEELCAWIVTKAGAALDEEAVRKFCQDRISHYKIPRYIRFVESFPSTVTGKVQKFAMREAMIEEFARVEPSREMLGKYHGSV